jgi:hypothetical protein
MAKGKKSTGKTYISNGERRNVSKAITKAIRRDYLNSGERIMNQLLAYHANKKVMVTIENPNKNETNKRFIRVPANQYFKPNEPFIIP